MSHEGDIGQQRDGLQGWGECDSFDADDLGRCELVGFDDLWCVDEVATTVFGMPTNDV